MRTRDDILKHKALLEAGIKDGSAGSPLNVLSVAAAIVALDWVLSDPLSQLRVAHIEPEGAGYHSGSDADPRD